jgi:hypothetical protein
VYSGVRYYTYHVSDIPVDGKVFFTLDLPLSAVTDTLLLPFTFFVEPEKPDLGWSAGCRWVSQPSSSVRNIQELRVANSW